MNRGQEQILIAAVCIYQCQDCKAIFATSVDPPVMCPKCKSLKDMERIGYPDEEGEAPS